MRKMGEEPTKGVICVIGVLTADSGLGQKEARRQRADAVAAGLKCLAVVPAYTPKGLRLL